MPGLTRFEKSEDRQHPPVLGFALRQVELGQDAADVFFDGALGDEDPAGDAGIGGALGHQGQDLALAHRQRMAAKRQGRGRPRSAPDE